MFNDHVFLYVEDEELSREVMRLVLQDAMQVDHLHILENSVDFTNRIEKLDPAPDIFLLDIHVKPLDGFEMLNVLRAHPRFKNVKIIAVTASVMSEEVNRIRQVGFDGAIAKPVRVTSFPDVMARILTGKLTWHLG